MPGKNSSCPHVTTVGDNTWEEVHKKRQHSSHCDSCRAMGPNLWLCLHSHCLYVGCGESAEDHSSTHAEERQHWITLNMTTMRIWCYECECEVIKEKNNPPLMMRERSLSLTPLSDPVSPERASHSRSHSHQGASPVSPTHSQSSSLPDDTESDDEDENQKPRGLTGLQNIGNTCYMNAAIQALSNCPPLTRFFLDCPGYVRTDKKPMLSRSFLKLMCDMWHKKRPSYVVPSSVAHGIKMVHPMFRGYTQQDSQEFLRCFMDQLHEELKSSVGFEMSEQDDDCDTSLVEEDEDEEEESEGKETDNLVTHSTACKAETNSQSDTDYETCDSGLSSERSSVEHSISSGDEGAAMDTDRNSLDSQGSTNTEKNLSTNNSNSTASLDGPSQSRKNTELDRDSAICSSNSSIAQPQDNASATSAAKSRKDSENMGKKQSQSGSCNQEPKDTLVNMESGELSEITTENETSLKGKTTKSRHSVPSTQKIPRSRHCSDDKPGRLRTTSSSQARRKKSTVFKSVISDTFDGKILSSVQCLTCERVSSTKETFQDLSLPIPSKDHLHVIHASQGASGSPPHHKGTCGEVTLNQGWVSWMFGWMKSWFWGPTITLKDCLAAFFSADELKGDNMYSCDKCKKLRNGIKYSKVLALPEVLCIHLKRFRHEFMFSTKINSYVSFPLEGLDMGAYLHKDCKDQITVYDLVAVICHHGTAGGGHYTAYSLNYVNEQWYEFDDQYVTEVDMQQVENAEAYVLFYRKKNDHMLPVREKASQTMEITESTFMKFYVSKQWINKFNTFSEPGPISNDDFLCRHGGVHPNKWSYVGELVQEVPQKLWEFLHERFGGGPAVSHLSQCTTCEMEKERLKKRQKHEMETFVQLHTEFQNEDNPGTIYAISMQWFKEWENFVRARTDDPPFPIDNSKIAVSKSGVATVRMNSDYGQLSLEMWQFLYDIYGGGPELVLRQAQPPAPTLAHQVDDSGDTKASTSDIKV